MTYNKAHLISLLWYIGIGLIAWSISHGFFSWTRSIIMAGIWIVVFITAEYLKSKKISDMKHIIIWSLIYSIAIGMVSGGLQHFLDSPERSLWIVPVWRLLSTAIFPYKEELHGYNWTKSMMIGGVVSVSLWIIWYTLYLTLPADVYQNHHNTTNMIEHSSTVEHSNNQEHSSNYNDGHDH